MIAYGYSLVADEESVDLWTVCLGNFTKEICTNEGHLGLKTDNVF